MSARMADEDPGLHAICGRSYPGPWLPRYARPEGAPWKKRIWVPGRFVDRLTGYDTIWVCRLLRTHWKATVKPSRERWRQGVRLLAPPTPQTRRQRRLARLGKWKEWGTEKVWGKVHTRSWELGHVYSYSRREKR
jgi:hypothetical protein